MELESWDELRTAYHVARAGTVSGAAQTLGVHHATVIRHVDALEERLGVKLFQRHARGYTATEAGQALHQVGRTTEDQFAQLLARIQGTDAAMQGDLTITSLPLLAPMLMPALARLQGDHPQLRLHYVTETRVLRLEYGEAHVAIRAGARPQEPDNVVQPFCVRPVALFAAPAYADRYGLPQNDDELSRHRFLRIEARAPAQQWLDARISADAFVMHANHPESKSAALQAGLGLGFAFADEPAPGLIEVLPARPEWAVPLWLVSHVDLHRSPKVQAALAALKSVVDR